MVRASTDLQSTIDSRFLAPRAAIIHKLPPCDSANNSPSPIFFASSPYFHAMSSVETLPTLVVVGAGIGTGIARSALESMAERCNVIIIDEKDYYEWYIGTLRAYVLPEKGSFLTAAQTNGWKRCQFVPGRVKMVTKNKSVSYSSM
jgi:hypothetical protein